MELLPVVLQFAIHHIMTAKQVQMLAKKLYVNLFVHLAFQSMSRYENLGVLVI